MKKAKIPAIHVPVQKSDGSMEWVWYMFFEWLSKTLEGQGSGFGEIDGGFANSVYLDVQLIDGGNANG